MAKMKISELEQKYKVDRKEIEAFLKEKGMPIQESDSVDEAAAKEIAARFGSADKSGQSKSSEPGTGKTSGVKTVKKVVASAGSQSSQGQSAAPAKKKKIIIVTNNSGQGAKQSSARPAANNYSTDFPRREAKPTRPARPAQAGQTAGGNSRQAKTGTGSAASSASSRTGGAASGAKRPAKTEAQTVYRPIKPKVVPTQMQVDFHKPPVEKKQPRPAVVEETETAAAQQAVQSVEAAAPAAASAAVQQTAEPAQSVQAAETSATAAAATATAAVTEQTAQAPKTAEPDVKALNAAEPEAAAQEKKETAASEEAQAPEQTKETQKTEKPEKADGAGASTSRSGQKTTEGASRQDANARQGRPSRSDRGEASGTSYGRTSGDSSQTRGSRPAQQGDRRPGRDFGQGGRDGGAGRGGRAGDARSGRTDRPMRQDGARPAGQGGRASFGAPAQAPSRPGQDSRGGRKAGFTKPAAPEDAKRRYAQNKDKRGKKPVDFIQDESRERKNRPGRFIKPVVEKKETVEEQIKVIHIPEKLTIRDLAETMHIQPADIIKKLFLAGKMMTVNSEVSYDEAENIAADYDILCEKEEKVDVIEELLKEDEEDASTMEMRPPVVCVMGHVDHGKTSLLDYIRKTNVTGKEAGGITQAIGAYTVDLQGRMITFLDTPGHEAFTAMRMRGANSTDIAVLVIAADDGVMPQTVEAINHAKAAGVEIIVAINKVDKPEANPDAVKTQLSKYELIPTEWGGSTEFVPVSAKTGQGVEDLLETILLTADVLELKANPNRRARGLVLEARLDKGRGPVANVLIQKGTLHVGDFISAGAASGKVRALINDKGERVKEAGPSIPVAVLGLSDVPSAGEVILAHADDKTAKSYAETYKVQHKEELLEENRMSMNAEDLFDQMREGKLKQLDLIVKADVQGSVEALCTSLNKLSNEEVMVKIIHSAVGAITESDVSLALASKAAIIGFNVSPDATAKSIAEHGGVSIHLYKVIYEAIDAVEAAMKGMLAPVYEEKVIGHAEVRQIFRSGKIGNIAGAMVLDGYLQRGCSIRLSRGGEQIYEGELASLKRFKDDVKEVKSGFECGLVFKDFDSMNVDDVAEAYIMVEVPRDQIKAKKA